MSVFRKLQQAVRLFRFRHFSKGTVTLGEGVTCQAPIRSDCRGVVVVGARTSLGFRRAPKLGDGEILLQPRARDARIEIGEECAFSNNITLIATKEIVIGRRCLIGDQVMIVDSDFHGIPATKRAEPSPSQSVRIGDNVWLGSRVMVLKGVTIGNNSVVAAGSIVTRDIPADCVAGGVPARVLRPLPNP